MDKFWNERYSKEEYAYGKSPNKFFETELEKLTPGKLLLPGEGEGRNAVFAASIGWEVEAVDQSEAGKKKALKLAEERNTKINYLLDDITTFSPKENYYDVVGLVFVHLPEELRKPFYKKLIASLKPGGKLILETFEKEQANKNSGGPKEPEQLQSLEEVIEDFIALEFVTLSKEIIQLNEGLYHKGESSVIRFVGSKK